MKGQLNLKNASSVTLEELAFAFNTGFEGYFNPMQMDVDTLARRVRMEHLDLQQSFLADNGEEFVGVALFALRGSEVWCGGLGIAKKFRRRGVGKQLMAEFFSRARICGARKLRLEVLTKNLPAIRLYEQFGMRVTRDLLILERTGGATKAPECEPELKQADPAELLPHFDRLHRWRLSWQREFRSLMSADGLSGLYLGDKEKPDAYALIFTRPDGVTQILDVAANNSQHAEALVTGLTNRFGTMRLVNEPEESLFVGALTAHRFVEVDRQHEMSCWLS